MKVIHTYSLPGAIGKYELHAEEEPTVLANKTARYMEIHRVDVLYPYKIANIIQIITNNSVCTFHPKPIDGFQSEKKAIDIAMYWLKNKWNGEL